MARQRICIRLACIQCDREDFDHITSQQLRQAIKNGWKEVERVQSYQQACRTYENTSQEPAGFSVFEWWTHLGCCPECAKEVGED